MRIEDIIQERVDVVERNRHFDELLSSYYETGDKKTLEELQIIIFQCACNQLKSKYGHYESQEWIIDKATEILTTIATRITNFKKWPGGYKIFNLPTVVKFAIMTDVWKKPSKITEVEWNDNYDVCFENFEDKLLEELDNAESIEGR